MSSPTRAELFPDLKRVVVPRIVAHGTMRRNDSHTEFTSVTTHRAADSALAPRLDGVGLDPRKPSIAHAAEMKSIIMSFWLLTVAFGNLLVPIITKIQGHLIAGAGGGESAAVNPATFHVYASLTLAVAIVFIIVAMFYKERELQITSATTGGPPLRLQS